MTAPQLVRVPAGWFWMGSDEGPHSETPRHRVFTGPYDIAATTVRRSEYACFLEHTGHPAPRGWEEPALSHPEQPVVGVSWFDAVEYCRWLSARTGEPFRLPTEAEWERASRCGDDREYFWGSAPPESLEYYRGPWPAPRPVGEQAANAYGLFNMGDNVHEWCLDWYDPGYYEVSPPENPRGPSSGRRRASRGGSWRHAVKASRTAERSSLPPDHRYTDYGFRLVRSIG